MMYELEFPDGEIQPYAAIVIVDNIWAQVDPYGQRYVTFDSIINHHVDSIVPCPGTTGRLRVEALLYMIMVIIRISLFYCIYISIY